MRPAPSATEEARPRSRRPWSLVAFGLFWSVLCGPALAPGLQLGDRDTARLYYPVKRFFAEGLAHGELRFWAPWAEGGLSLHAQMTPGLLHPFTLLYLALPFELAFTLNHLLALALAGLGAWLLSRRLGASEWAALCGAIAFAGCGALVSAASSNLPYALGPAAVPLALAALFWFCEVPRAGRLLGAGAALALCAYGGDPQSMALAGLIGFAWAAIRERAAGARKAALWMASSALLSLPVVLPALSQLARSSRAEGVTQAERRAFGTSPQQLLGLAIPGAFNGAEAEPGAHSDTYAEYVARSGSSPFHESILFGVPALLLAFSAGRRARVPLAGALFFALAALGGPLETALSFGVFRYAEKLLAPTCLLLAMAAALGAERALVGGQTKALRRAVAALGIILLLGLTVAIALPESVLQGLGRTHDPALPGRFLMALRAGLVEALALCAGTFAACALRDRRGPALATGFGAALCAISALRAPPLRTVSLDLYRRQSSTAKAARALAGTGPLRVWVDASQALLVPGAEGFNPLELRLIGAREALWPQLQALDGFEGITPYFSAPDARLLLAMREAPQAAASLLGARLQVLGRDAPGPANLPASDSGYRLLLRDALPAAFLVSRARAERSPAAAAHALRTLSLREEALLTGDDDSAELARLAGLNSHGAPPSTHAEKIARPETNTLELELTTAAPGLLVLGEHYDAGWSAWIDDAPAAIHEADLICLSLFVPKGSHHVRLHFRPAGLLPGLAISALAAAALTALRRRRVA